MGFEYAFDCNADDANGYDAPFLKNLTDAGPIGFSCPTSDEGTRTVGLKIRDKDGDVTEYTDTVTISNVTPDIEPATDQSADEGRSRSFYLGSFYDPGDDGPWEVTVNWGDGSQNTTFQADTPGEQLTAQHAYANEGTYTVRVKVAEARGTAVGSGTFGVTVALPATGGIPLFELLGLIGGALLLGIGVLLYALVRRRV